MKIAIAQINTIIGDLEYNSKKIIEYVKKSVIEGAELIVFQELCICGYPPKDLLLKKQFIIDCKNQLNLLIHEIKNIDPKAYVLLGYPEQNTGKGKPLFNSVVLVHDGKIIQTIRKILLPTYDIYDEDRYFEPGKETKPVKILGKNIGISICEDMWCENDSFEKDRYLINPIGELTTHKLDLLINCSASLYAYKKLNKREMLTKKIAKKYKVPLICVNQVGGNDDLIFDGSSRVINEKGEVCISLKSFKEDSQTFDLNSLTISKESKQTDEEDLLQALILGIQDYIGKCGFKKVLIGLSGGIDSALVACIATLALGKENVIAVAMPSRYTSDDSNNDAKELANNLGIELKVISIEEPFKAFLNILNPHRKEKKSITEENMQSRIRGLILMSLSNETGALVLSTGNKSELATGYCTLYGDMCGGLSVISDLSKTLVYKLARYINEKQKTANVLIPENIIKKAPTAELKPNQKDEDSLPPYETLDKILSMYVEEHLPFNEMTNNGTSKDVIEKICNLIDRSEYKRKQATPGLKLTSRSFGYGWRMPVANKYNEIANNKYK